MIADYVGLFNCSKVTNIVSKQDSIKFHVYGNYIYLVFYDHIEMFDFNGSFVSYYERSNDGLKFSKKKEDILLHFLSHEMIQSCFIYQKRLYSYSSSEEVIVYDLQTNENYDKRLFSCRSIQDMVVLNNTIYVLSYDEELNDVAMTIRMYDMKGNLIGEDNDSITKFLDFHYHYHMATFDHMLIFGYYCKSKLFLFSSKLEFIKTMDIGVSIYQMYSDEEHLYVLTPDKRVMTYF